MSNSAHAVHVYQPGNIPPFAENTERARYVVYGTPFTGAIFKDAFIHDAPINEDQKLWLEETLSTRIAPGGKIRHLESPSPVSTAAKPVSLNTHGIPITGRVNEA